MKVLYAVIYIAILGVLAFPIGRAIPKRLFSGKGFFFKSFKWEKNGSIYEKLKIKSWHKKAPDMSRFFSNLMPKKAIEKRPDYEMLLTMTRETCVAELTHWCLFLAGFLIPVIAPCAFGYILFAAYSLFGNLIFIIIQRYNRPRLIRLMEREKEKRAKHPVHLLILSCNTGGGHNSVANSIREIYESEGYTCDIRDALSFISGPHSVLISGMHTFSYNFAPFLFNRGWRFTENHRPAVFGDRSIVRHIYKKCADEINRCLMENGYSLCICTHVFAGMLLSESLKKHPMDIKSGIIETDYTASPGSEYCELDFHFMPSPELADKAASYGIPRETIIGCSIPLRKQIYESCAESASRRFFDIPEDMPHILIMFGSIGNHSSARRLLRQLDSAGSDDRYYSVVCGNNENLYKKLKKKYADISNVKVLGFVKEISMLMDSADIVVTKPGGISLTELAVKRKPAVLFRIVDGCEKDNTDFFLCRGAAADAGKSDIFKICSELLEDSEARKKITDAAGKLITGNGAEIVIKTMRSDR